VLKLKYKARNRPDAITADEYERASTELVSEFGAFSNRLPHLDIATPYALAEVRRVFKKYPQLDFADAYQLLSVKSDFFSKGYGEYQTVFVTYDQDLADAATAEGIRVLHGNSL